MTPEQIAKARKIISKKNYYKRRRALMIQIERWWTEQFYMYGHHQHVYYTPDISWRECQRYRKRAEYYKLKINEA